MNKKKVPQRKCVGCGEMKEKNSLVRVVKDEDGRIFFDETGKKNGRGAYLCKNSHCLQLAEKNHGLERSLKQGISKEIYEELSEEIAQIESK